MYVLPLLFIAIFPQKILSDITREKTRECVRECNWILTLLVCESTRYRLEETINKKK